MDLELKDKVVVISGAAGIKGSIGETMVRHLVNEGAIPGIIAVSYTHLTLPTNSRV